MQLAFLTCVWIILAEVCSSKRMMIDSSAMEMSLNVSDESLSVLNTSATVEWSTLRVRNFSEIELQTTGKRCKRDVSKLYRCGPQKGKDTRTPCVDNAQSNMMCNSMVPSAINFAGIEGKCRCKPGHCWIQETRGCEKMTTVQVVYGGSPAVPDKQVQEIDANQDIVRQMLHKAKNTSYAGFREIVQTVVSPLLPTLKRFSGTIAREILNMDRQSLTKYVQWVLAKFVLQHDDANLRCETGKESAVDFLWTKPAHGNCYLDLSHLKTPDEPLWRGPIFSRTNGRDDHHRTKTDILLAVKIGQIRGLESLKVTKNQCYGDILTRGGFCDLEVIPHARNPLMVKDVELTIDCEGDCYVSHYATALLNSKEQLLVGEEVYIQKERAEKVHGWLWGEREVRVPASLGERTFDGRSEESKGRIWKTFYQCKKGQANASCQKELRYCVRACITGCELEEEDQSFEQLGCYTREHLVAPEDTVKGKAGKLWRKVARAVGGQNTTLDPNVRPEKERFRHLLYRKFNGIFTDVKIRARVYIHRTRSLQQHVNDAPKDQQEAVASRFGHFFQNTVKDPRDILRTLRHPREWALSDQELVQQYDMNVKPKKNKYGRIVGYELATCSNALWNEENQDYTDDPYDKCYKIDIVDLQMLATSPDFVSIEQTATFKPTGFMQTLFNVVLDVYSMGFAYLMGYDNTGLLLAACTKILRMMFVREVVTIRSGSGETRGKYCKDKWHEPWLKDSANTEDQAYAVGIVCSYSDTEGNDEDQRNGMNAAFDFEFVELTPEWNTQKDRNDMVIGLRGGYNLQFCRVVQAIGEKERKAGAHVGQLLCDLDVPIDEDLRAGMRPQPNRLPPEARFTVELIAADSSRPNFVIESRSANGQGDASDGGFNENALGDLPATEEMDADAVRAAPENAAADANSETGSRLAVRLKNKLTGGYCAMKRLEYKTITGVVTKKRQMLTCDHKKHGALPLVLEGNIDPLRRSPLWDILLLLIVSCVFAGGGYFVGFVWYWMFGVGAVPLTGAITFGIVYGLLLVEGIQMQVFHYDSTMLRYVLKQKLQGIGQYVLWCTESALVFEFSRP